MNPQQLCLFSGQPAAAAPRAVRDKRLTHYAVIEVAGQSVVWGIGKNRREAIEDAVASCVDCSKTDIDNADDMADAIQAGEMIVVRCSRRLFKEVGYFGGNIRFMYVPGVGAFLPAEQNS